jgi:hypothetical protein
MIVEIEHPQDRPGRGVEGLVADPPQSPVIFDEAEDRCYVIDAVIDVVALRQRRNHKERQPLPVASAVQVRPGFRSAAEARAEQRVVGWIVRLVHDRRHHVVVPAVRVVVGGSPVGLVAEWVSFRFPRLNEAVRRQTLRVRWWAMVA